jgi:hypothetical protein
MAPMCGSMVVMGVVVVSVVVVVVVIDTQADHKCDPA